jgi:plasmid stabilization system protein ParE
VSRDIEFLPEARDELDDAYQWYEDRRDGLGEQFVLAVEATVGRIQRLPESHTVVHRDVRRALVERFPYGVFFTIEPERIVIIAVFHARRDPDEWKGRDT